MERDYIHHILLSRDYKLNFHRNKINKNIYIIFKYQKCIFTMNKLKTNAYKTARDKVSYQLVFEPSLALCEFHYCHDINAIH